MLLDAARPPLNKGGTERGESLLPRRAAGTRLPDPPVTSQQPLLPSLPPSLPRRGERPGLPPGRARPPRGPAPLRPPAAPAPRRRLRPVRAASAASGAGAVPGPVASILGPVRSSPACRALAPPRASGPWRAAAAGRAPPAAPRSRPLSPGRRWRGLEGQSGGEAAASARAALPPSLPALPAGPRPPLAPHLAAAGLRCAKGGRGSLAPLSPARRAPRSGPAHAPLPGPGAGAAARGPPGWRLSARPGLAQSAMSGSGCRRRLLCGGCFRLGSGLAGRSRRTALPSRCRLLGRARTGARRREGQPRALSASAARAWDCGRPSCHISPTSRLEKASEISESSLWPNTALSSRPGH